MTSVRFWFKKHYIIYWDRLLTFHKRQQFTLCHIYAKKPMAQTSSFILLPRLSRSSPLLFRILSAMFLVKIQTNLFTRHRLTKNVFLFIEYSSWQYKIVVFNRIVAYTFMCQVSQEVHTFTTLNLNTDRTHLLLTPVQLWLDVKPISQLDYTPAPAKPSHFIDEKCEPKQKLCHSNQI